MSLLRRALSLGALLLVVMSLALLTVPGWIVERVLDQGETPGDVWLRLLGAGAFSIALVHVLIVRKLEDLWWWCWAFVAFDGLTAVIAVLHAVAGVPEGSARWPWWLMGAVSGAFTAAYLGGLARAGQEKPFA
jgi:hypothetical protein